MSDPTDQTVGAEAETRPAHTVTVEYNDADYAMPSSLDDVDGDVVDAIDDEKLSHALKSLLGPEQWKAFKATKPTVRDYGALFAAYAKVIGLETTGE
jgi:hypothetical protein